MILKSYEKHFIIDRSMGGRGALGGAGRWGGRGGPGSGGRRTGRAKISSRAKIRLNLAAQSLIFQAFNIAAL